MALISRIALRGPGVEDDEPEDFLNSSLGVIFPDDVTNQHGDAHHSLVYTSPHLRGPLHIALAEPEGESDRRLFSHYLWNSSLLLAELVEAGTLGLPLDSGGGGNADADAEPWDVGAFTIRSRSCLELGAGTALPSIVAALLGARSVVATDYPSPAVLGTLRRNAAANGRAELSPLPPSACVCPVAVEGHAWGDLDSAFAARHRGRFDRVFVCDCLWMPWQHANLHRSIAWFLRDGKHGGAEAEEEGVVGGVGEGEGKEEERQNNEDENGKRADADAGAARAWVIAGFHTGRASMRGFFDGAALRGAGLAVERIWERDCDGVERAWAEDRGAEDPSERKRWLVVAVLKRWTTEHVDRDRKQQQQQQQQ